MTRLHQTFDASQVAPAAAFSALPAGRYTGQIVHSELRATRDGRGQYLYLELQILEGAFAGRKLFDRLNLINPNPATVEIAQRVLSAICHAVGKLQVNDSEELHGIPMALEVKVRPAKEGWGESNTIQYHPLATPRPAAAATGPRAAFVTTAAAAPAPQSPKPPAAQPAAAGSVGGLPWKRAI